MSGTLAVVRRGIGQPLEIADRVVAGVAHGAAAKGGQLRQVDRADRLDLPPQLVQRVVALELPRDQRGRPQAETPEWALVVTRRP